MKKFWVFAMAAALSCSLVVLSACGGRSSDYVEKAVEAGQEMTDTELLAAAKEETGNFVAYGNTSRITTAMTNFIAKYGTELGLTESNATATKLSDSEIYTLLSTEAESKKITNNASMVLIQDSATLASYREQTTLLRNYVPKGAEAYMDDNDMVPLAQQFINKLFIWNNTNNDAPAFSNVWELTESTYANKIYFKSPTSEQVNMNFLIMLTNDEWSAKLETAYLSWSNNVAATDVGNDKTYANYGYKWIAEFLANCDTTSYTSDTKMAAGVSSADNSDKVGLFVLSKFRDESVTSDNLTVGAWTETSITPFAGFMYALYAQVVDNGPRPYTAMLFINYLMTEEGFTPWASLGGYSSNSTIDVTEGDSTLSFWKEHLVFEDGTYINSVKTTMEDWINTLLK